MRISIKEHLLETMQKRQRVSAEIVRTLMEYPDCMNGDLNKRKVYQVAVQYFVEKQNECRTITQQVYFGNNREEIELCILLDCYQAAQGSEKREYVKKIALKLIETQEYYLMRISEQIKKEAFQITIQYFEEQMRT